MPYAMGGVGFYGSDFDLQESNKNNETSLAFGHWVFPTHYKKERTTF